ncbi:MAG: ATP-dependent helicase HrpB, partial [Bacteroidales bacterium]|nr:ATP-dependent helicase HrpB [Bacteroidales bacterium]
MTISEDIIKTLPAYEIADKVNESLKKEASLVITAPPGAGKSTLLPLTILKGLKGKILMLEPRRLAARQIAGRMASTIGEKTGETVGYRIRFETKVSSKTRIEVLTEGILTKMLVSDPTLDGVDAVIFDEYHERSLASDLALALTRESQKIIRPDLKIILMSATIDADNICKSLNAPLLESKGRMFPVETKYCGEDSDILNIIRIAHKENEGDILVFLPGEAEIQRCFEVLNGTLGSTKVYPLYGMLSPKEQQMAIAPSAPGERKVVLSTPIAETSLTIEGVRVVVDSGLCRKLVFNRQTSLSSLETVRISMDMATQRAGRAGRVAPGICYRLWNKGTESLMADTRTPEILEADLTPMVLDVAAWGESDVYALPWMTPPPQAGVLQAKSLLTNLGAIDAKGQITKHGNAIAALPCHPRIANMLIHSPNAGLKALAADIAALLEEKDPLSLETEGSDISIRLVELRRARNSRKWARISRISRQYCDMARVKECDDIPDAYAVGALIARAYPERIAKASDEGIGNFLLSGGDKAFMDRNDALCGHGWIAIANLNARPGAAGRIFLASPLDPEDIKDMLRERDNISWDSKAGKVIARH